MKINFTHNSILASHYKNYLNMLANNNNKLVSQTLSDLEISQLYDNKYSLTEFDIYKYIIALDYITQSLGCSKYTLTEGITDDKYKYNNILIDLFYQSIHLDTLHLNPISTLFENTEIEWDESVEIWDDDDNVNYTLNRTSQNYSGNSYTYYIFKQLIKLFLTEVYLYKYKGAVLTYKELVGEYENRGADPNFETIPMSQWILKK